MLKQNATITFDPQIPVTEGREQVGTVAGLVLKGELLPDNEMQHHLIATLFDEKNPPKVNVEVKSEGNKLTYELTLTSDGDVLAKGKEAHDLHVEARNFPGGAITVEELKERKAEVAKAKAKADKKAKD